MFIYFTKSWLNPTGIYIASKLFPNLLSIIRYPIVALFYFVSKYDPPTFDTTIYQKNKK